MSRRTAREIAFKTLFQWDLGKNDPEPTLTDLAVENGLQEMHADFARELVNGTIVRQKELDEAIRPHLQNWQLDRLAVADRSVLRLAAYELLFRPDIPVAVAINEALELSKIYNSDESAKFLNGVLDKIAHDRNGRQGDA